MGKVQRRATKMVPGLKNLQYEDRFQRLGILNLSARWLCGDLTETFKIMNSHTNVPYERSIEKSSYLSTRRATSCNLGKPSCKKSLQCRSNFFSHRLINNGNKLPEFLVSSDSGNSFKANLGRYWLQIGWVLTGIMPLLYPASVSDQHTQLYIINALHDLI